MKILWAPEASADFDAAVDYLAERNAEAAKRIALAVFDLVELLAENPIDGPTHLLRSGEIVRGWPLPPFRIYYQRSGDTLVVVRLYHQKREPITR